MLSIVIIPQPFIYHYLSTEIGDGTPLERFESLSEIIQNLTPHKRKSLNKLRGIISLVAVLLPSLNVIIHAILSQQENDNAAQEKENFLNELQQRILRKQKQYSQLFEQDTDDPFAQNNTDEIQEKAEQLQNEILHLKHSIQQIQ